MGSPQNSRWMPFLDDNLLEVVGQPANSFLWPIDDHQDCIDKGNSFRNDTEDQGKLCPRKRSQDESFSKPGMKACREKMRRDRLHDRFMELSALLEPDSPPKTDKSTILCDAISALNKLRDESCKMKKSNEQLQQAIKEMKTEKNEIRDEKTRLKAEKENLEQQIKAMMTMPPGFMAHPATIHAFAAQYQAAKNKLSQFLVILDWQCGNGCLQLQLIYLRITCLDLLLPKHVLICIAVTVLLSSVTIMII